MDNFRSTTAAGGRRARSREKSVKKIKVNIGSLDSFSEGLQQPQRSKRTTRAKNPIYCDSPSPTSGRAKRRRSRSRSRPRAIKVVTSGAVPVPNQTVPQTCHQNHRKLLNFVEMEMLQDKKNSENTAVEDNADIDTNNGEEKAAENRNRKRPVGTETDSPMKKQKVLSKQSTDEPEVASGSTASSKEDVCDCDSAVSSEDKPDLESQSPSAEELSTTKSSTPKEETAPAENMEKQACKADKVTTDCENESSDLQQQEHQTNDNDADSNANVELQNQMHEVSLDSSDSDEDGEKEKKLNSSEDKGSPDIDNFEKSEVTVLKKRDNKYKCVIL